MTPGVGALAPDRRWPLALGVQAASGQAAWHGVRLMIAYQALEATGSPAFVGVVAAVFALAGLLVSVPSGRLIDRYGSAWVTLVGSAVCVVGIAAVLISPSIPGMLVTAAVVGAAHIYVIIAQQGLVARLSTRTSPDAAFGTLTAAVSIGQLVGPPIVTAAAMWGSSETHPNTWLGMACCGLLLLVGLPTFFVLRPAEARAAAPATQRVVKAASLRDVLVLPGIMRSLLVGAAVIVTVDLLASFIPVWAVAKDIPASVVGWLLALRALFTISSRFGVARLVDRFGRKALLIVAISMTVVALVLLPFAGAWSAIPVMALLGLGLGLPQPLTLAWMSSLTPPHARGSVFGARMTMNRLAQVTLPLLVATAAGPVGVLAVFWTTAGILASSAVLVGFTKATTVNDRAAPGDGERDTGMAED